MSQNTAEKIYERVKSLPESTANEVLDFIEFLESRQHRQKIMGTEAKNAWLSSVWGSSPDFPDRLPDPNPEPVEIL